MEATLCRQSSVKDVTEQARSISAWEQNYLQLSGGAFKGSLDEIRHRGMQFFHEYTSQATYQVCQPWPGAIWFGIGTDPAGDDVRFNGRTMVVPSMLFSPSAHDFSLCTPDDYGIFGVVLSLEMLESWAERTGHRLPASWRRPGSQPLTASAHQKLAEAMQRLLDASVHGELPTHLLDAMAERVIAVLFDCMKSPSGGEEPVHRSLARHAATIRQARALLLDPEQNVTSVETLGSRLYMTRRTLQNCFREVLGITPLAFIHAVRLQALRQALRDPAQAHLSIHEIAARHEFWNLSHVGQGYKRQFGETPAQTRQRRPQAS
jgi:AraC family transcriptional regulator, ethanolamine operon transcriptional activator